MKQEYMNSSAKKWALYACMILLAGCWACSEQEEESAAVQVETAKVQQQQVRFSKNFPASVVALQEVDLRADVAGYVTQIMVKEGQKVPKGELLYTIDQTRYQARKQQAESSVAIAEGNVERLQKDFERYERLREEDAIAGQIYDNARIDLRNAQQELNAARSELENIAVDLQYASIRAPFEGTIGFSQVRLGTLVSPGETLLNTISRDDPMGVDFYPEEQYLTKFQSLFQNDAVMEDSVFRLRLSGGTEYPHLGEIEVIDRAVDRNTGTIQIRLIFPNPDNILRPGQTATLIVRDEKGEDVILAPRVAVSEQMGEFSVFVRDGDAVRQVKVKTGRDFQNLTVIEKGLQAGDEVVVKGVQKLSDGDKVEVVQNGAAE